MLDLTLNLSLLLQYEQNGFVVIEDFITADEVTALKNAGIRLCHEAAQDEARIVFATANNNMSMYQDRYFIDSGDKVRFFYEKGALNEVTKELVVPQEVALNKAGHALHTEIADFKHVTFSERVKEVCWQLKMKKPAIAQSMYIYKNPGVGGEVIPHQDGTFLLTEPASTIGFWIALDDATPQNGCLQFIRGSHKGGVHRQFLRNPDTESSDLLIYDKPAPIYPASNFVSVPVPKGMFRFLISKSVCN